DLLEPMDLGPNVERARRQLARIARRGAPAPATDAARDEGLLAAALAAFPDRVGRRRAAGSPEIVLEGGGSARLDEESVVREAPLLVAVEVEERRGDPRRGRGGTFIRLASAVTPELLLELFPDRVRFADEVIWNAEAERVDAASRVTYGDLVI